MASGLSGEAEKAKGIRIKIKMTTGSKVITTVHLQTKIMQVIVNTAIQKEKVEESTTRDTVKKKEIKARVQALIRSMLGHLRALT